MPDIHNDDAMAELYANDAAFAMQALNEVLENGEPGELLVALRQMTKSLRISGELYRTYQPLKGDG